MVTLRQPPPPLPPPPPPPPLPLLPLPDPTPAHRQHSRGKGGDRQSPTSKSSCVDHHRHGSPHTPTLIINFVAPATTALIINPHPRYIPNNMPHPRYIPNNMPYPYHYHPNHRPHPYHYSPNHRPPHPGTTP